MSGRIRLERWLDEEVAAFRAAIPSGEEERPLRHLCQALGWVYALDELFQESDASYVSARDVDTGGAILRGVRFARNRVFHQAIQPGHRQGSGFAFALGSNFGGLWFMWKPVSDLTGGRPDAKGKASYEAHMQGNDVGPTLDAVKDWFSKVR